MLAVASRTFRALTLAGGLLTVSSAASAQYFDPCTPCAQPVTVMANPCPCLQPVTETVYREVPVTKYRAVERTVQKPVIRTAYEEREVTAYRQVNETRTAEVPGVAYQQCTTCQQVTQNRSFWRTNWQPTVKMSPCQYDPNPTFMGAMNRMSYSMRMALTPNYIPRREYVPNLIAYNVPVTQTVAVPTTRTVTYNVAKLEPYTTTQRVAVQKVEYVDATVTAYEPYTEMRTVAVGNVTRYAFVDPSGTATAARPTPATADGETIRKRTADADDEDKRSSASDGDFKPLSYPRQKEERSAEPSRLETNSQPQKVGTEFAETASTSVPTAVRVAAGWRPSRTQQQAAPASSGPALSVVAN
jgi:hypothetical protein